MSEKSDDVELTLLLADFEQRQQEILDRGKAENQLFVVFFAAFAALTATAAALLQLPSEISSELSQYLPTLVVIGSLVLFCLPVAFVHLANVTDLRRVYIQERLEPRLRELYGQSAGNASTAKPFTFEAYDRETHKGWFDILIGFRSGFICLPAALLFCYYLHLRWTNGLAGMPGIAWWVEIPVITAGLAAVVANMWAWFRQTNLVNEAQ